MTAPGEKIQRVRMTRRKFAAMSLAAALASPAAAWQRLPKTRDVPWLAEVQRPPETPASDAPALFPLLVDAGKNPIRTREHWERHRAYLRQQWLDLIGEVRPRERLVQKGRIPPEWEIRDSAQDGGIVRRRIRYETERGHETEAYLLMPHKPKRRLPAVVVLHSTVDYTIRQGAGLEGPTEAAWGLRLAERGMVVICPRCFLWDDMPPANYEARVAEHRRRHPLSRGIAKMLYDARRAVDLLESLNEVDAARIGAAGHSLGAKEALYLAAFDERIRACVSSEGGIGTTYSNWDAPWYWGDREFFGREHHELLALAAPRAFLLIGGNSADGDRSWPFIEAALSVYRFYGEPCRLGFYNHAKGHTIPRLAEQRTYEWLQTYL
jgi:dienelactone hydrolase